MPMLNALILAAAIAAPPTFDFHSNFWINLHHFLYHLAQPPGPPPRAPVVVPIGPLAPDEQRTWDAAIAYYRANVIRHDLLFDDEMTKIKSALADAEQEGLLNDARISPELARVLNGAAPIYRRHWWPTHDAGNRLWISAIHPLLDRLGARLASGLAAAYATPWYPAPIRVDVSAHAGVRVLAYTTGTDTGHVIVSSTDPCDQGYAAVETLYHEASHTIVDAESGAVGTAIIAAARRQHVAVPEDMWHALMFYTQGELLKRELAEQGIPYEPESGICDVYRGPWVQYREAADLFWRPHLFGKVTLDSAVSRMVEAASFGVP